MLRRSKNTLGESNVGALSLGSRFLLGLVQVAGLRSERERCKVVQKKKPTTQDDLSEHAVSLRTHGRSYAAVTMGTCFASRASLNRPCVSGRAEVTCREPRDVSRRSSSLRCRPPNTHTHIRTASCDNSVFQERHTNIKPVGTGQNQSRLEQKKKKKRKGGRRWIWWESVFAHKAVFL